MPATDTVAQNKATFERIVDMFNTGDVVAASALFAPDYVDHQRPDSITVDGPDEFVAIVSRVRRSLPDLRVRVAHLMGERDLVAARLTWHGTDEQGTRVERGTIEVMRFVDGRAAEHWGAEEWRTTPPRAATSDRVA